MTITEPPRTTERPQAPELELRYIELAVHDGECVIRTYGGPWTIVPSTPDEVLVALDQLAAPAASADGGLESELRSWLLDNQAAVRRRALALGNVLFTGDEALARTVLGELASPVSTVFTREGSARSRVPVLVAITGHRPEPDLLDGAYDLAWQIGATVLPLWFESGCWFLGPLLGQISPLDPEDLLGRLDAAGHQSSVPDRQVQRHGSLVEQAPEEQAWLRSTVETQLARLRRDHLAPCLANQLQLNPQTLEIDCHLVLPLPCRIDRREPTERGETSVIAEPVEIEELIDRRTGIVLRTRDVDHDPSIPRTLRTVHAYGTAMRVVSPWLTDSVAGGTSFVSATAARGAAIGEAVERYSGDIIDRDRIRFTTYQELTDGGELAVDPASLVLFSENQYRAPNFPFRPLTRDLRIGWIDGRRLGDGAPGWVPASLVYANYYTGPFEDEPRTNNPFYPGLAAGPDLDFAIQSGLLEVLERHSTMVWWTIRHRLPAVEPTERMKDLLSIRPDGRLQYSVIPIDNEFEVPIMAAAVRDQRENLLTAGFAARFDPEEAALKAVAEALTLQDGARDLQVVDGGYRQSVDRGEVNGQFMKPWRADRQYLDDYQPDFRDVIDLMSQLQIALDPRAIANLEPDFFPPKAGRLADVLSSAPRSTSEVVERLSRLGHDAWYVDVTTEDVCRSPLRVVRVLVPGLVPNFAAGLPFLGLDRIRSTATQLNWPEPDELNFFPLPHA